jgi:hypothetical protein
MYYIGIFNEKNKFYFFTTLMHRKTARRLYEPFKFDSFDNVGNENLKKIINSYQTSNELTVMKKKFSQSGRPPRKVLVPPEFIFTENDMIQSILEELRVSKTRILYNSCESKIKDFDIDSSKEKTVFLLDKTYSEGRIIFERFSSDFNIENELENLNAKSFDDLHPAVKAFSLAVCSNESGKIKIKRY